jgi:DNA-directed RNA polymerase I, II, and III subunit RPABC2
MAEKFIESDIDDESDVDDSSSEVSKLNIKATTSAGSDDDDDDDDVDADDDVDLDIDDDDDEDDDAVFGKDNNDMDVDSQVIDFSDGDEVDDDDDELDDTTNHLQKFNETLKQNIITEHHPELIIQNYHEVEEQCVVIRNEDGTINDPRHRTVPFITKYEKAKILGERAKQINAGATPFVDVNQEIIDGYLIALAEFEQKKIPMIIRRPLPNGQSEYWKLEDLEFI